jgi:hypothetical protein
MTKIRSTFLAGLAGIFLFNTALVCAQGAKLTLGTKVEKRVVQNERDRFAFHDGQVWAQIELKPSTDGHVTFVWTRDGKPYSEFKSTTKRSDRYRTQAFVTARPGKWHVAVKSDANVVLAEKNFVVDGVDGSMTSQPHDTKATSKVVQKVEEKADTQKVSGINEALKAMNPTDPKPEVKTADKPAVKVEASPKKAKTDANAKTDSKPSDTAKPVDAKPAGAKTTDAKPVDAKATDAAKPAIPTGTDVKPVSPKA